VLDGDAGKVSDGRVYVTTNVSTVSRIAAAIAKGTGRNRATSAAPGPHLQMRAGSLNAQIGEGSSAAFGAGVPAVGWPGSADQAADGDDGVGKVEQTPTRGPL
jgi:hypothetical protein